MQDRAMWLKITRYRIAPFEARKNPAATVTRFPIIIPGFVNK